MAWLWNFLGSGKIQNQKKHFVSFEEAKSLQKMNLSPPQNGLIFLNQMVRLKVYPEILMIAIRNNGKGGLIFRKK